MPRNFAKMKMAFEKIKKLGVLGGAQESPWTEK